MQGHHHKVFDLNKMQVSKMIKYNSKFIAQSTTFQEKVILFSISIQIILIIIYLFSNNS